MSKLLALVRILLGTAMLAAVAINFGNVLGRFVFSKPLFWAEEAIVFIQIWCVFIGAALVSFANAHLRMDAFEHLAPAIFKRLFGNFVQLLTVAIALAIAVVSARIVIGMIDSDQRSIALEIPMAIPYAALPIGFLLIALIAAMRVTNLMRGRPSTPPEAAGEGAELK